MRSVLNTSSRDHDLRLPRAVGGVGRIRNPSRSGRRVQPVYQACRSLDAADGMDVDRSAERHSPVRSGSQFRRRLSREPRPRPARRCSRPGRTRTSPTVHPCTCPFGEEWRCSGKPTKRQAPPASRAMRQGGLHCLPTRSLLVRVLERGGQAAVPVHRPSSR